MGNQLASPEMTLEHFPNQNKEMTVNDLLNDVLDKTKLDCIPRETIEISYPRMTVNTFPNELLDETTLDRFSNETIEMTSSRMIVKDNVNIKNEVMDETTLDRFPNETNETPSRMTVNDFSNEVVEMTSSGISLNHLPNEILEIIFKDLSFQDISNLRMMNQRFNELGKRALNKGYQYLKEYHKKCEEEVKQKLSNCDEIENELLHKFLNLHRNSLNNISATICLLDLTFSIYVKANRCCFYPGEVIDKNLRVLRLIKNSKPPSKEQQRNILLFGSIIKNRCLEIINPLINARYVSNIAIEYFVRNDLPNLKLDHRAFRIKLDSTPKYFSGILMSVLSGNLNYGLLEQLDLDYHNQKGTALMDSLKSQIDSIHIQEDTQRPEQSNFVVERVLGYTYFDEQKACLIKWKETDYAEFEVSKIYVDNLEEETDLWEVCTSTYYNDLAKNRLSQLFRGESLKIYW